MILEHADMVENILKVYRSATAEQVDAGGEWYSVANSLCHGWAEKYGVRPDVAAQVLAVISPRLNWDLNVAYAEKILRGGTAPIMTGTLVKVRRILNGEHMLDIVKGQKIINFYLNVMLVEQAVTVDRHAFDIAMGEVGDDLSRKVLERKGVYERVADAYREVAKHLGITAFQLQAITWVVWREAK